MKNFVFIFFLASFLLPFTLSAKAADEDNRADRELFIRYLSGNPHYNALLRGKVERLFRLTFPACTEIDTFQRLTPVILVEPTFRNLAFMKKEELTKYGINDINPASGQWIDRNLVEGCGKKTQLNFISTAYDISSMPEVLPTVNGQTKVEIIDQRKVENTIKEKLNETIGCLDQVFVLGTIVLGYKTADTGELSPTDNNAGWYERWVVEACNTYHNINLAILPDGKERFKYVAQIAKEEETDASSSAK